MTEWPMRKALACLIGSTCFTLCASLIGYWLWSKHRSERMSNPRYWITGIIQTGPEKEALKTAYLAELLGLSADRPTHLYAFNPKKGEEKLLACPLISSAKVQRLPPSTLYVDYEVRKPIAWIADFKNTAIDETGHLFPVTPFFSPKNLPELYLGLSGFTEWKTGGPSFELALELLHFLETAPWKEGLKIQRIDVSNAFAPSLGQREIVLFTEEEIAFSKGERQEVCIFPKILRIAPKDYPQQLGNFFSLRKAMMEDYQRQLSTFDRGGRFAPRIIDLRIPQLAFVQKG